ncbi:MAG TPA: tetratricopeptide repeat protein [Polyangiaceae bacterium]|nr:tetratricopeptide repeat protein [Polyangiaceae bacterium]
MRWRWGNRDRSANAVAPASCNRRSSGARCAAYGLTLLLGGCSVSGRAVNPAAAAVSQQAPAQHAAVPALIVSSTDVVDVEELFLAGQTHLRQGEPANAAAAFDRIVQNDPLGPFGMRALFQGALAHEQAADLEGAAARFEQLERRFPAVWRSVEASIRAMRVRLYLEQWEQAGAIGALFLERHPHGPVLGRILSHAARGLGLLAAGSPAEAEHWVSKGLDIVEQLQLDRAGSIPRDLAPLYFALGETRRQRAEAMTLDVSVREFSLRLEQRCQLLLAAQSAYSDTMRAYDAHWSTMAGYRVGELYERLHEELMRVPPPRAGSEREQQLFEGAMRLRYSVLLGKANAMLAHTLDMAARTGEDSEWVRRTERSRTNLTRAMAEEQAALDRLPFTREDLQRALDDLAARARPASP